jgi:hypothetical protein
MGTTVAKRTTTALQPVPIPELARQVRAHIHNAQNAIARLIKNREAAGQKLLELRHRVEAGEAGKIGWWDWYEANIGRSRKDGEKLMRLAAAENPELAFEEERAKDRDRKRIARSRGADVRSIEVIEVEDADNEDDPPCEDTQAIWRKWKAEYSPHLKVWPPSSAY